MPWLRLWHGFLDNPKVQDITRCDEALRARYVNLLCVACRANENGKLPSLEQIAFDMRFDLDTAQRTLDDLVKAGLIEKNGKSYCIHDWEDWQCGQSPAARRQKRYRQLRNAKRNALRDSSATEAVTHNVTRDVTYTRARASEGEEDKELIRNAALPSTPLSSPACAPARERPTPVQLSPDEEAQAIAKAEARRAAFRAAAALRRAERNGAESDPDVSR